MEQKTASCTITRRGLLGSAAATLALGFSAPRAIAANPLSVVTTTGMIADTARVVGGTDVEVQGLMGAGVDPHAYRQTRSDIVAMTRADLVLWHGLYLEAQMESFFEDLARKKPVVAVGEAVSRGDLLSHEDYAGRYDPHIWMDPILWKQVVDQIAGSLTNAKPEMSDSFAVAAEAFKTELEGLDAYTREVLATLKPEQKVLVTAHDAFGYFGHAYDFEVLGVQGISTESEAGLNRISEMVDTLVDRDIRAVFVETSVSDRNMRALIEGAAAKGHEVTIGGSLFSDAMGVEGSYEGTLLGMVDHNATTIARALGADAPQGGWSGKLTVSG